MQSRVTSSGGADRESVDRRGLADALKTTLGLRLTPVALSFVLERPESVDTIADEVPSACALWRRAERQTFFAPASAHDNCPIGALTMGFDMSDAQKAVLMELVGKMCTIGYVDPAEASNIPSVPGAKSGIVYGPLETFPIEPDVVLTWVTPNSAMLLAEATGTSQWTETQRGTATFGRPSCGAIPIALKQETATFSLGCTGMRTYTGVDADLQLAVLPQSVLPGLARRLESVSAVNAQMLEYYAAQNARFASV